MMNMINRVDFGVDLTAHLIKCAVKLGKLVRTEALK